MPNAQLLAEQDLAPCTPSLQAEVKWLKSQPRTKERADLIVRDEAILALRKDRVWLVGQLNKALMRRKG
jgi:hypothetical protein